MTLHVKYNVPKPLSTASVRARIMNVVKWINDEQLRLINNYLWTWKHRSEIEVTNRYGYRGGDAFAEIYIVDHHRNAFWYVEEGTRKRYAHMTPDFIAKTRVRATQSGQGQGGLAFVNPRRPPRPGIQGRHVLVEISKILLPSAIKKMTDIIRDIGA